MTKIEKVPSLQVSLSSCACVSDRMLIQDQAQSFKDCQRNFPTSTQKSHWLGTVHLWQSQFKSAGVHTLTRIQSYKSNYQGPMLLFFKYFRRKIQRKNWRLWLKTKLNYEKKLIITLVFKKNANFLPKIVKNSRKLWS
jgi:hypothetical protein